MAPANYMHDNIITLKVVSVHMVSAHRTTKPHILATYKATCLLNRLVITGACPRL